MAERKRRTDAHRQADVATKHVELVIARAGYVSTPRQSGADYGLDLGVDTFDDAGCIENEPFWIQVKSVARVEWLADGERFSFALDRRDVVYWLRQLAPVILTVHDASTDVTYWVDVQRVLDASAGIPLPAVGERVTIQLARTDVFDPDAVRRIRDRKNTIVERVARRPNDG